MKYLKQFLCVAVVVSAGCSNGTEYRGGAASPPTSGSTDFTTFVVAQFVTPPSANETMQPINVETTNFTFSDDDNPNAFDTIIATSP